MCSSSNSFKNLIESFNKMCSFLENDAEMRLKEISEDRLKELNLSAETLKHFDDLVGGMNKTCSELIAANDVLQSLNKNSGDNFFPMSYDIQSDTRKCINNLFNMPSLSKDSNIEKLGFQQKKELLTDLIALAEKNISDLKDAQNIALEVKNLM